MFQPPRCPYPECPRHADPRENFCHAHGSYRARCRPRPIPRFRCRTCRRTFSRQTFRADYHDKKPHLNPRVVEFLNAGVGLRKSARILDITRKNFVHKWRKIARNARRLDLNLKSRAARTDLANPDPSVFELDFDELETYETRRNTRPLSVPAMIEDRTRLILGAIAAPIRPKGTMTKQRLAAIEAEDARFGPRKDRSPLACRSVFRSAAKLRPGARRVRMKSDEKHSYPGYFEEAFPHCEREHSTTSSKAPRGVGTPLFAINLTEAILRDHMGRVRRDSWLTSKLRTYLNLHLAFYIAWKNWVLPRFNRDVHAPGVLAGITPRNLTMGEFLGWRQDWGKRSPCPFSGGRKAMEDPLVCPLADELRAA
jgi:transposase-like protein